MTPARLSLFALLVAPVRLEPPAELVFRAVPPSTAGVSLLAAIASAAGEDVLGALPAGALAAMGIASLAWGGLLAIQERASGAPLYLDRRAGRLSTRAGR